MTPHKADWGSPEEHSGAERCCRVALTGSQEVRGVGGVDFCGSLEGFMGRQLGKVEGFVVRPWQHS